MFQKHFYIQVQIVRDLKRVTVSPNNRLFLWLFLLLRKPLQNMTLCYEIIVDVIEFAKKIGEKN